MNRAELNLLNNRWRYPGGGDYSGLFRQFDATAEIRDRVGQVPGWLDGAQSAINGDKPEVRTGKHCHNPYECQFQDHCRTLEPPEPDHPIELLPDVGGKSLARKLREKKGYLSILDPSPEELTGLAERPVPTHSGSPPFRTGCHSAWQCRNYRTLPVSALLLRFRGH